MRRVRGSFELFEVRRSASGSCAAVGSDLLVPASFARAGRQRHRDVPLFQGRVDHAPRREFFVCCECAFDVRVLIQCCGFLCERGVSVTPNRRV